MNVITKHGASKPSADKLLPYQTGYDTRANVYGQHAGKELFINDNGEVRAIGENYLKKEFVNYPLECDKDGNVTNEGGATVYTHAPKASGLLAHLQSDRANVVDENGTLMAERVRFGAYQINTKDGTFSMPGDNTIEFYSVAPTYLAQLKNSLEQKALYVVETRAALTAKIEELAEKKELEPGVQFIVRHDESQGDTAEDGSARGDTVVYVVTNGTGETKAKGELSLKEYSDDTGSVYYKVESEDGVFDVVETITLEYLYHDPVAKDLYKGMGLEVINANDADNTIVVGMTDDTINTIEEAYNHGYTINEEVFGTTVIPTDSADRDVFLKDGAKYANYVPFVQFTYDPSDHLLHKTQHYIDFSGFILDEGTWDAE